MELMVRSSWTSYCLKGRNIIGLVTYLLKGKSPLAEIIKNSDIKFDNSVLDVGCGSGIYLHQLKYLGYKNLMGIDPYIEQSSYNTKELSIVKKSIYELDGSFDFIMMNHSFEHVLDPLNTLKEVYRLLKPKRYALISIPIASSYAFRYYAEDWFQLDAPRHIFIHSESSIRLLAKMANFQVSDIIYDSTAFSLFMSDNYKKGISYNQLKMSRIARKSINKYKLRCIELNEKCDGDSASIILYKT